MSCFDQCDVDDPGSTTYFVATLILKDRYVKNAEVRTRRDPLRKKQETGERARSLATTGNPSPNLKLPARQNPQRPKGL